PAGRLGLPTTPVLLPLLQEHLLDVLLLVLAKVHRGGGVALHVEVPAVRRGLVLADGVVPVLERVQPLVPVLELLGDHRADLVHVHVVAPLVGLQDVEGDLARDLLHLLRVTGAARAVVLVVAREREALRGEVLPVVGPLVRLVHDPEGGVALLQVLDEVTTSTAGPVRLPLSLFLALPEPHWYRLTVSTVVATVSMTLLLT